MSKKILQGLLLILFIVPPARAYRVGDANGDSIISLVDVIYMVNFIFKGTAPPKPPLSGDVNSTCTINLADIIGLVNYIFHAKPIQGCPDWGEAQNLGSPPNSENAEYHPSISSNSSAIWFAVPSPPSGLRDIYYSTWNGSSWSTPVKLNNNINTTSDESSPSISADGKKLYFTAYEWPGGYGGDDIWVSEWDTVTDDWGPATNLGPNINTGEWESNPSISADGRTLYFFKEPSFPPQSQRGIYKSQRDGTTWGPAVFLSDNLNFYGSAQMPSISADGLNLYYVVYSVDGAYVYVSYWNGTDWTLPEAVVRANEGGRAAGPCISYDGRKLYFYSDRQTGSYGGLDIYVISR